ncbi:MAG TPA: hypothetical protein VHD36_23630 [Pirellulales bacterium]|nr:hypothetical protein [Pirellulales bacterium]
MADNYQVIGNLYNEMENQLFLGDRLSQGEFACFQSPGQFVSTNLKEVSGTDDMWIQFDLVDPLLDSTFQRTELPGSISEKFKEILHFSALPTKSATAAEEREIAQIRSWLRSHQAAYDQYADDYDDADRAYQQEANSPTPNAAALAILSRRRTRALTNWSNFGYKRDYENRQATLNQILKGYPQTFWMDIQNAFGLPQNAPRGDYYSTYFYPPSKDWGDPATSWASFSRTIDDSSSHVKSRSTSWSAGGGIGFGLWSFGASAGGSTQYNHRDSDTSHIDISFEFLRVRIQRPWFTPDVFSYRWWTWTKTHGPATLSDGGNVSASPPVRPLGQMPFVPTHFILARKVKVIANFSHNDQTFVASQCQAGASVGWGPFSISGSYSESNSDLKVNGHWDGSSFAIDQPQIIAYTGFLLPTSPNPLPKSVLPWGDDAWLPGGGYSSDDEQMESARLEYLASLRAEWTRLQMIRGEEEEQTTDDALRDQRISQAYKKSLTRDLEQLAHHHSREEHIRRGEETVA